MPSNQPAKTHFEKKIKLTQFKQGFSQKIIKTLLLFFSIVLFSTPFLNAELNEYTKFIKNAKVRQNVEKQLQDNLHSQLEKKLGSDIAVETYLKILDDYSHGDIEKAKIAIGEETAKILLKFIAGASGASLISAGWDFAKWSYSSVQKWAEDLNNKKFIEKFLMPRVKTWQSGVTDYTNTADLRGQFDDWFSLEENFYSIIATKPALEKDKYLDKFKGEMWAKVLEVATKYRSYYRQKKKVEKKAQERKTQIKKMAMKLYQEQAKKEINAILDIQVPDKKPTAKEPSEIDADDNQNNYTPSVQNSNTAIKAATLRCQTRLEEGALKDIDDYEKKIHESQDKIKKMADLDDIWDWQIYSNIKNSGGIRESKKENEIKYHPTPCHDKIINKTLQIYPTEKIKTTLKKKNLILKTAYNETKAIFSLMDEKHDRFLREAEKLSKKINTTIDILKKNIAPKFILSDIPIESSIAQYPIKDYQNTKGSISYFSDCENYMGKRYTPNNPQTLNTAVSAANTAKYETEKLLHYMENKHDLFDSLMGGNILRAEMDYDDASEWYEKNMSKFGPSDIKNKRKLKNSIDSLNSEIQKLKFQYNEFEEAKDYIETQMQGLLDKTKAVESKISWLFLVNKKFEAAISEAKGLNIRLDKSWLLYADLKQFNYYWNLESIPMNYTLKSPKQIVEAMDSGNLVFQPGFVSAMQKFENKDWRLHLKKTSSKQVKDLFSDFSLAKEYIKKEYTEGIFPINRKIQYLFPAVKNETNNILLPFIKRYADYALDYGLSHVGPLYALPEDIYAQFLKFENHMPRPNKSFSNKIPKPPVKYNIHQMALDIYAKFKRNYSYGNISGVLACIDENWISSSGQDYFDLEDHLRSIFGTFKRFTVNITNLKIEIFPSGKYAAKVSYMMDISANLRNHRNIKHEEKGIVTDYLILKNGKLYIAKTEGSDF